MKKNTQSALRYLALALLFVSISVHCVIAQPVVDNMRHRFGVSTALAFNIHSPNFKQLPNVENCCPQFQNGSGTGFAIGVLYEHPLTKLFSLGIRGTYMDQRASLLALENTTLYSTIVEAPVEKTIEHRIDTRLSTFGFEPMININPAGGLRFHAGTRLALMTDVSYSQRESITENGFVFIENQLRTRNERTGILEKTNMFQTAILLGASIEFPLNKVRTILLAPEIFYQIGVSNVAPDISWRTNAFRLGIALKFANPPIPEGATSPLIPLPVVPSPTIEKPIATTPTPTPITTVVPEPLPQLSLRSVALDEQGNEEPLDGIRIEEVITTGHKPLLPYVFFDERSGDVPQRYNVLRPTEPQFFTERSATTSPDILAIYHHVLNIVGRRMLNNSAATITLTGCTDGTALETTTPQLARRRAESIKKYLTTVWRIPAQRITIEVRGLPQSPSRSQGNDTLLSHAENRRVEITSNDDAITAPLTVRDTSIEIVPKRIRFIPTLTPTRPLRSWTLRDEQQNGLIAQGGTTLDNRIEYSLPASLVSTEQGKIFSPILRATLAQPDTVLEAGQRIRIERVSLQQKKRENRGDTARESYGLIIFDYGKSELTANHKRIMRLVRSRTTNGDDTRIRIEGFTDEIGDAQFNAQLALERATAVANDLNIENAAVIAVGESSRISNATPEGRFYNRTVSITIERK